MKPVANCWFIEHKRIKTTENDNDDSTNPIEQPIAEMSDDKEDQEGNEDKENADRWADTNENNESKDDIKHTKNLESATENQAESA